MLGSIFLILLAIVFMFVVYKILNIDEIKTTGSAGGLFCGCNPLLPASAIAH